MTTMNEMNAEKERQRKDAETRDEAARAAGIDPRVQQEIESPAVEDSPSPAPVGDDTIEGSASGSKSDEKPKEPERVTPSQKARAAIAGRFKQHRGDPQADVADESDVRSQGAVYGAHTVKPAEGDGPDDPPAQDENKEDPKARESGPSDFQAPRKIKLKVRGQERELTEDEVVALAQKNAAADDYMAEARQKLDQAETILSRAKAQRGAEARQHPDEHDPDLSPDLDDEPADRSQHPETDLEGLIKEIRYGGDDKEAAEKLGRFLNRALEQGSEQADVKRTMSNDARRTKDQLVAFFSDKANADIADEDSQLLMREKGIREMREDLRKLGISEDRIPPEPSDITTMHRYLRITGQNVRTVEAITKKVAADVRAYRGNQPKQDPQPKPAANGQPRVAVDRSERRLSVPQQPARATALPAATPQPGAERGTRHSAVVQRMRARRGQIVA